LRVAGAACWRLSAGGIVVDPGVGLRLFLAQAVALRVCWLRYRPDGVEADVGC
jgi:hypothetical protein